MSTKNIVRTLYLYLFALTGLVLTIIGVVMIVNLLLKNNIFKVVDYNYNNYIPQPTYVDDKTLESFKVLSEIKTTTAVPVDSTKTIDTVKKTQLTDEQIKAINSWVSDYQKWSDSEKQRQEIESKRNYSEENNNRTMANSLSMIIVGFPIYLIHWVIIIRDIKRNKEFGDI